MEINCAPEELVSVNPPSGSTCGTFFEEFIRLSGGYITNPTATDSCLYCSARTTDEWMQPKFNIRYENHWRDFGIFWGYIVFNVSFCFCFRLYSGKQLRCTYSSYRSIYLLTCFESSLTGGSLCLLEKN